MLLFLLHACTPTPVGAAIAPPHLPVPAPVVPRWPESNAMLTELSLPPAGPRKTVFLVGGHANGRHKVGNTGIHGQLEAEVNLEAVLELAQRLEALDRYNVVVGRRGEERPSYGARIRHAERVGADVFIELHTDARGYLLPYGALPSGEWTYEAVGEDGFSILYNEGGPLGPARHDLAVAVGASLERAGFKPYPGWAYRGLYDPSDGAGVFIDRRGLMMLRRPTVPSIIIETHNAKDFEESLRWRDERTHAAFAAAVAHALGTLFPDG